MPSPQPASGREVDWQSIRARAKRFPPAAFEFIRDGLTHTVAISTARPAPLADEVIAPPPGRSGATVHGRHITGQQLCAGLRDLARERYGPLAITVLNHWGFATTEDFGTAVYALIDKGEMRASPGDRLEDFSGQYDFTKAFQ